MMVSVLLLSQVLVVTPGGPLPTLGAALERARPGDSILVRPGTYRERIVIDRRVTIVGQGWPVLDGGGAGTVVTVTADSVALEGLVIRNVRTSFVEDRAAILLDGVSGCRVEDNIIEDSFFGIYGARSADCLIARNRVRGPRRSQSQSGNAIHLWNCRGMTVRGNEVTGHRDGIYLEFGKHTTVSGNTSSDNLRYGLHFMFSDSSSYQGNVFRANGAGVAVMYTREVTMRDNRFERNWGAAAYGLLLKEIQDARVERNTFTGNSVGLFAEGSVRLRVAGNLFSRNGWAVKVMANATDGVFEGNTFSANTFDVVTNSRSATSTFRGNYWDAYRGYDLDGDGFGDLGFRPVRLFALFVAEREPAMILLRSFFVDLLDTAERILPVLTPETLVDARPLMRRPGS